MLQAPLGSFWVNPPDGPCTTTQVKGRSKCHIRFKIRGGGMRLHVAACDGMLQKPHLQLPKNKCGGLQRLEVLALDEALKSADGPNFTNASTS